MASKKTQVEVDSRTELASVVQLYAPWVSEEEGVVRHVYMDEALRTFEKWRNHRAVRIFTEMFYAGQISYDALVGLMVHLSDPPTLDVIVELARYITEKAGSRARLAEFIKALQGFASESNFIEFYLDHEGFYEDIIRRSNLREELQGIIKILEDFFRMSMKKYYLVLTPLLEGNYGHWFENRGDTEAFAFISPTKVVDGFPVFENVMVAIEHEFMHAFVNPMAERFKHLVDKYSHVYEKKLADIGYHTWEYAINEFIIRACTIVIESRHKGLTESEVNKWLSTEEKRGFKHIKIFYDAIKDYARKKGRCSNFQEFYPKMFEVLSLDYRHH